MRGNALTETLVFGARAGKSAADWAKNQSHNDNRFLEKEMRELLPHLQTNITGGQTVELKRNLRKILWEHASTVRNREGLMKAEEMVKKILEDSLRLSPNSKSQDLQQILELQNGLRTALLIIRAALFREESRGAHFRIDFPEQDDNNWLGHVQVRLLAEGEEQWSFEPTIKKTD
jgi:succinate dehydrogenase/fumarate reductase flavoprotein subunit